MHIPRNLKKGDTIGILSTARKINAAALQFTINLLESWGLKVVLGSSIGLAHHQFAGTAEQRLANFQEFLDADNIAAILCARGGYGTMQIIDDINWDHFLKNPKWICGFSDVTVLHSHLSAMGVASIHSSMPSLFPKEIDHETLHSMRRALMGESNEISFPVSAFNKAGNAEGNLVGGNLSLIYALQGSDSDIDTNGKILFLEDLDEYLYHIDRMMISIDRAGKLKGLKGLLIGGMTAMKDHEIPFGSTVEEIILRVCKKYNFPIYFNFPAGHLDFNFALKLQCPVKITCKNDRVHFQQL